MKREKIIVDKNILKEVLRGSYSKNKEYLLIEDTITSSDAEDGGADHTLIIKRVSDNKFFCLEYCDWDIDYNFEDDFPEELDEVFPLQKTITVYE